MLEDTRVSEILFQPLKIGGVTVKNRLAMSPIAAHGPTSNGRVNDQTIAFFEARAKGEIGLIVVGGAVATTHGWEGHMPNPNVLRLDKDEFTPDLRRLTQAVQRHGVPIFAQLITGQGRMGKPGPLHIAASALNVVTPEENLPRGVVLPGGLVTPTPREATIAEIEQLEEDTAASALRMRRAGFDGVELGAHMSYFLSTFLSPRTNWRTDKYGGDAENRARVVVNIIKRIRAEVDADYPVGVRMPVNEHVEGGLGPEGFAEIAVLFVRAGASFIDMTDGGYETVALSAPERDGQIIEHGEAQIFRKTVPAPRFIQAIHDPRGAAAAVAAGHADMVMLGRPMLADPEFARKVKQGRMGSIVACNRDNHCLRRLMLGMPIRCPVNPRMGRESRPRFGLPPLRRLFAAPMEALALRVTRSRALMGMLMRLTQSGAAAKN